MEPPAVGDDVICCFTLSFWRVSHVGRESWRQQIEKGGPFDRNHFGCDVTEQDVKNTADAFVATGMKAAGYTYGALASGEAVISAPLSILCITRFVKAAPPLPLQ